MSKLVVRNNWESLEWSFKGERIDARKVTAVVDSLGIYYEVVPQKRCKTYNDHGHTYSAESTELVVGAQLVGGLPVYLKLSETPSLLNSVEEIEYVS